MYSPELLSPIADFETCLAAVHNGCDAVYVGVPGWNARGRVPDLTRDELQNIIEFCHLHQVRVFFAMNVLVFEQEIRQLSSYLKDLISLGPDAFIIQDPGLGILIKHIAPNQEIHASTQMTLSSLESVQFVEKLGFKRVVLARELNLNEIAHIRKHTEIELEVFVHGALCISYSGQCLTSENFGGRSANRGQCAQSCRLPYDIWVDSVLYPRPAAPYLFSPKDLCALDLVPKLMEIGVHSFKIEGRLKSPEYIAATTRAYREKIDGLSASQSNQQLESLFSRGFFSGWLQGVDHQKLVDGKNSAHQGVLIGKVHKIQNNEVWVKNPAVIPQAGDGCAFVQALHPDLGGRIYHASTAKPNFLILQFARNFPLKKISVGAQLWRNNSPSLEKSIRQSWENTNLQRTVGVQVFLNAQPGHHLSLRLISPTAEVELFDKEKLQKAHNPTHPPWLKDELAKLGSQPFAAQEIKIQLKNQPFLRQKTVRQLRQKALQLLEEKVLKNYPKPAFNPKTYDFHTPNSKHKSEKALLNILLRQPHQLEQISPDLPIDTIFLDYDYGQALEPSLNLIENLGYKTGIATLRIHKSGENKHLKQIIAYNPQAVLVRHWGALSFLQNNMLNASFIADHSFNISNSVSAQWLLNHGIDRILPAWDLNQAQLHDLLKNSPKSRFEVALHQYLPTFHIEHCVFANVLTSASSFPQCKIVCRQHNVEVEDHKGEKHFLQSDAECRNTLFLGKAQSMLRLYDSLRSCGVNRFRIDLLQESAEQAAFKINTYSQAINESISIEEAFKQIGVHEKYGISEGQLFNTTQWQDRKQLKK